MVKYSIKRGVDTKHWMFAIGKINEDYLKNHSYKESRIQLNENNSFIKIGKTQWNDLYYCQELDITILLSDESIEIFFNIKKKL